MYGNTTFPEFLFDLASATAPFDYYTLAHQPRPNKRAGAGNHCNPAAAAAKSQQGPTNEPTFTPLVDFLSTPSVTKLWASLPGATRDDIDITYDPRSRQLTVSGRTSLPEELVVAKPTTTATNYRPPSVTEDSNNNEKPAVDGNEVESVGTPTNEQVQQQQQQPEVEHPTKRRIIRERKIGRFERTVLIDGEGDVDEAEISAKFVDGVLEVTVPKHEPKVETRKVLIQ